MPRSRSMLRRHLRSDLRRDPGVTIAIAVMITLSACLMASGAMVMERLVGAVDELFEQAQPPHFLQMHKGDYDVAALEAFAEENPAIEAWFIEEMIGFDGGAIAWERGGTGERGDLSDSLVDNLFVTQNTEFDFLLDAEGGAPHPDAGEVYVPVMYAERDGLQAGDVLTVITLQGQHELTVAGTVRDAQMASSMSSATRFVVSPADFEALVAAGGGVPEIIVEYLVTDPALATDLQTAYAADPALPMNGEDVTYALIRTLNVISDGLAAITLMGVALLLVAIALLSLHVVIRGRLQDDVRQIGAMKAIGLPHRDISRLYLASYVVLTAVGCVLGGALAVVTVPFLTRGVQASYAASGFGLRSAAVLLLALGVVVTVVVLSCRRVLRRVATVQVVDALVHGSLLDAKQTARRNQRAARRVRRSDLVSGPGRSVSRRLAVLDLRAEARQWLLIPAVLYLAALVMALPAHMLTTLSSPSVVTSMGMPEADLVIDLQHADDLDERQAEMAAALQRDDRLVDVQLFARTLLEVQGPHGWQTIHVEVGDYSTSTMRYTQGRAPGRGEIALSILNADTYQVTTGDELDLRIDDQVRSVVVSGIYADVTSGGDTAKMTGDPTAAASGYLLVVGTADGVDPVALAAEYGEAFPHAEVLPVAELTAQTMAQMTGALRSAAMLAWAFGLGVATLIVAMFLRLRIARDRPSMGTLSAIGFSAAEILAQLRGKTVAGALVGALLGSASALVLGGPLVNGLLSAAGLGVAGLPLVPNAVTTIAGPIALVAAALLTAVAVTARLRGDDTSTWLRA
ncbi:FtsX-like permease family protein [Pseudactinotalea sp.]|uniref:ABC transporter permease n=1 Tax=Pseudactinotalea sp. TaxID=1926260 RepID=UPI003B3A29A3